MMFRVMVVDDEQLVSDFLKIKIEELNPEFQVVGTAQDGFTTLDLLRENPVDLVITDIMMPGMDGLELCEKLRESYPDLFLVILSGYGEFEYAQRAIRYDVHSYLLKPIDNEELKKVLDSVREKRLAQNSFREIIYATSRHYEQPDEGEKEAAGLSIVEKAKAYVWDHYREPLGLPDIAEHIGVTPNYLSKVFHDEEHVTCMKYVTQVRMEVAGRYLAEQPFLRVEDIASYTGFISTKHFLHVFKKYYGMTCSEYKVKYRTKTGEENG